MLIMLDGEDSGEMGLGLHLAATETNANTEEILCWLEVSARRVTRDKQDF